MMKRMLRSMRAGRSGFLVADASYVPASYVADTEGPPADVAHQIIRLHMIKDIIICRKAAPPAGRGNPAGKGAGGAVSAKSVINSRIRGRT